LLKESTNQSSILNKVLIGILIFALTLFTFLRFYQKLALLRCGLEPLLGFDLAVLPLTAQPSVDSKKRTRAERGPVQLTRRVLDANGTHFFAYSIS
jgi:hypothetical protein